ncbi:unnamed protein product [Coffea canephora]|uniref:E3 ubiquitin-protein ligase RMA n=1 Tax=Coffea canephora TaxID=49390 RepID=A0A068V2J7_COFCA|nr:unnamed protein product [Coffea canephora]
MEEYFQEPAVENNFDRDDISLTKCKSHSPDELEDNPSGGLDCNICLGCARDPVVTFCGHLYCWPCIYKWIHFQSMPSENCNLQQPQCPVCKAELSEESVIPLYGRGLATKPSEAKAGQLGIVIPQRPPSPKCGSMLSLPTTPNISRAVPQLHRLSYTQPPQSYPQFSSGTMSPNTYHPLVTMLGEMVLTRMFGNPPAYSYPNSFHLSGGSTPRMRRQVMQADKSLSRICFFLCCSMVLCLLLF